MGKKEERIRQEAIDYAYRIAKTQGIEALEARATRSALTSVPLCMDQAAVDDFVQKVKNNCTFTIISLFFYTMHEVFGFGHKRLSKALDYFTQTSDALYHNYLTYNDITKVLIEEQHIDLTRWMPMGMKAAFYIEEELNKSETVDMPGTEDKKKFYEEI